ncbi:Metallo-dependent phosphatase [Piromyces finnis]|uniref:Metallo-dependent phosphatase n=1 Tax=Piromyces finnis TaxID=1754191 RepID=A0A1Y1VJ99_9FUNG|nr:Metallo-dependent phosphatase [Piromyces finnis]|eukprot:ORX57791.1 Metallo-dependent phosphatase [Piromyces finnis]
MNNKETKTVQPIKRIESLTLTEVLSADPTITTSVFQETPTTIVAPGEQQSEDKSDSNISTKEIPKQNKTKEIPKEISKEKKSESTYKRIVAVGDIHGDYKKLMKVLSTAKLVDQKGNWIAKDTILVQTGDLIDRGSDTILIFDLMMKIKKQAEKYNSIVYMLLGNHEVMNLQEDFRYVTRGDVMSFGGMANRKKEFSMEGKYGNLLRNEMNATMIVDDTLFVHAGLISSFAKYGVDQMNNNVHYTLQNYPPHQLFYAPLFSNNGPFWTRFMALGPETPMCEELKIVMDIMKIKRMVVGHTVQENGKINTRCDGKFLMIDVGMSSFYGGGFAYLEIMNDGNEIWAVYSDTERERID